ncbi:MAG: CRISPR-associated protein Cas4, partial [Lachnospiraceae bacterium]|nr:CRISPR-associated protein Cas4 [Lachnospiraceae bacterium]
MYAEEDYLMLSGIQHFAFCRRQWAMIHIEQQWAENYRTTAGELMHKKAHDEGSFEKRGNLLIVRGLRISSHELGLSGQCDVVEFHENENGIVLFGYDGKWNPVPIEYKHGAPKEHNADELQLCAQAVCLEEMFQTGIPEGYLYYGENRRRSHVAFTDALRAEVKKMAQEMHELMKRGHTPNVKPTKQCKACSLENLCVPSLQKTMNVREYIEQGI